MMSSASTGSLSRCPQCGAKLRASAERCWLCHAVIESQGEPVAASTPVNVKSRLPVSDRGFSLASLLMLMTLVAVVLGLFSVTPGLGILATIAVIPAALRTALQVQRRKKRGEATSFGEKAALFAASMGTVLIAGLASAIAFSATCWGGFFAGAAAAPPEEYGYLLLGAVVGAIIGAILAIWVFIRVMKAFVPKDIDKPSPWLFIAAICTLIAVALLWWLIETFDLIDFL